MSSNKPSTELPTQEFLNWLTRQAAVRYHLTIEDRYERMLVEVLSAPSPNRDIYDLMHLRIDLVLSDGELEVRYHHAKSYHVFNSVTALEGILKWWIHEHEPAAWLQPKPFVGVISGSAGSTKRQASAHRDNEQFLFYTGAVSSYLSAQVGMLKSAPRLSIESDKERAQFDKLVAQFTAFAVQSRLEFAKRRRAR